MNHRLEIRRTKASRVAMDSTPIIRPIARAADAGKEKEKAPPLLWLLQDRHVDDHRPAG